MVLDTSWTTTIQKRFEPQRDEIDAALMKATGGVVLAAPTNGHSHSQKLTLALATGAQRRFMRRVH